jgi:hypothetical protein
MTTMLASPGLDFHAIWDKAFPYDEFVRGAALEHRTLWEGIGRLHTPSEATLAHRLPAGTRLLVIAADWCGDAVNVVPAIQNWAAHTGVPLRIIDRDTWPEVMDHYLTGTARAIPIVIAIDPAGHELGHWGPRPSELQAWVMAHKESMPKDERYKEVRRWYARDKGASAVREVVSSATKAP